MTCWQDTSMSKPWQPMYLLRNDNGIRVQVGYWVERQTFLTLVEENGVPVVHRESEFAQQALDKAQEWIADRISSVWLWRLCNDQQAPPRPPRVTTRSHEQPGGTSVYAA